MSINDMQDALEATYVAQTWNDAFRRDNTPKTPKSKK